MTAIVEPLRVEQRLGLELSFGRVSVTEQVVAYQRKSIRDGDRSRLVPLDLPETSFETEAVWYLARRRSSSRASRRCRSSSARSTPPSTR